MSTKITKIVYVIKNANIGYSQKKVLDYVMDNERNIVCWENKDNANKFLFDAGMEDRYIVVQTTTQKIENELLRKKDITDGIGIRIIKGVDF